jgi:Family of unknown function (DUF6328)
MSGETRETEAGGTAPPGAGTGGSSETEQEKLTRNLNELLQELRVAQTGVQILTGFLLTLPFTNRFAELDNTQQYVYLAILVGAVISTGLIMAPVAFHRALFRQGARKELVEAANQLARLALGFLALTTTGVVWLVFDVVTSRTAANVAMGAALLFFVVLWGALPMLVRKRLS